MVYRTPCDPYRYAPDGLVGGVLDELIDRAYAEVVDAPRPTSARWMAVRLSSADAARNIEHWPRLPVR